MSEATATKKTKDDPPPEVFAQLDAKRLVDGAMTGHQTVRSENHGNTVAQILPEIVSALKHGGVPVHLPNIAMHLPRFVELALEGKFDELGGEFVGSISPGDISRIAKIVCKYLGRDVPKVLQGLSHGSLFLELIKFQLEGFAALAQAHQEGERDGAAMVYANQWVATILEGESAPSAYVLPAHLEAAAKGKADGFATLALWGDKAPEIAKQLLATYGSLSAVRRVLIVELYQRAGFGGIK